MFKTLFHSVLGILHRHRKISQMYDISIQYSAFIAAFLNNDQKSEGETEDQGHLIEKVGNCATNLSGCDFSSFSTND